MPKEVFKVMPSVYLIVKNKNKVLLSLRKNTGYMDGYYSLVAGHVDGNEPATFACIREAMEEAGMNLKTDEIHPSCIIHRLTTELECIDIFFIIENYTGNFENKEPNKCGELKYFDLDDLPNNTIDYIKVGIKNSLNGKFYCEYGFNM